MQELAKTFKSRDETEKRAKKLCDELNHLNITNKRNQTYQINKVDHTICSKGTVESVARELYTLGYKATNFNGLGWKVDPKLKDARFYSKRGVQPVLIRETDTQWGVVITLLGDYLPVFHDALIALNSIIDKEREVTVMHPVEGTSGIALICGLRREVTANNKLLLPLKLEDVLLSRGFVRKQSAYVSIPLGVLVATIDKSIVVVDAPWA
jgi:hypothetical protein